MYREKITSAFQSNTDITQFSFFDKQNIIITIAGFVTCLMSFFFLTSHQLIVIHGTRVEAVVCRIISGTHALFTFTCAYAYFRRHIKLSTWHKSLSITLGYLCFDFIRELIIDQSFTFLSITSVYLHHVLFIGIITTCFKRYAHLISRGLLSEITNLFLFTSWYFIKTNQQETIVGKMVGVGLLITFAIFRVYNFTSMYITTSKQMKKVDHLAFIPLILMNYYWFALILEKLLSLILNQVQVNINF